MPPKVQALAVAASLGLLALILYLIRKGRLREDHAILWLMAGFSILMLSAWRGSLTAIARMLDIGYAPSLLFAVGLVFTLLILLVQTAVMSRLAGHTRDLAQELSILQWQVQRLQGQMDHDGNASVDTAGDRLPTSDSQQPTSQPTNQQTGERSTAALRLDGSDSVGKEAAS